ncbi:MAG: hypothetical protein ABIS67_06720 [Candidatus Eisenbacteria bacterium]
MRRLFLLVFMIVAFAFLVFVWPSRWRYDHITVDKDTYLVRVARLTGHVDILVPELGWTPAEAPWDENPVPDDNRRSSAEPS